MTSAAFRQLLEDGNVEGLRRYWATNARHLPQPQSHAEAEITMHVARTAAESVSLEARRYSDGWLRERGHPSQLPGELRPVIAEAVGISVNFRSAVLRPAAVQIRTAMEAAVEDCYANGDRDPARVKSRMAEASAREMKALFGR